MAIHIDSCGDRETIVVNTRFNVYELIVLREEEGAVLVRGGGHFTEFSRVLFLGSTTEGGRLHPRTIDVGLRMAFMCGDQLVSTSAVQSVSKGQVSAISTDEARAVASFDGAQTPPV